MTLLIWYGDRSITEMALLTGYHLLGVALAGFVYIATARVYGKRHTYILGTLVIIISSIWGGLSGKSYNSMVAARFFQVQHLLDELLRVTDSFVGSWTGAF